MKTYTFSEYKAMQEMSDLERLIGELKKNKEMYIKVVFTLACLMNCNNSVYAATTDMGLSSVAHEIIGMVLTFGRYGCLTMGAKAMIESMLAGGNVKQATGDGIQYFIFYIVLNVYPKLFSMIKF